MSTDSRRMILVKGGAGLGNRILALLTAAMFARITKRRLLIDWRDHTYAGNSKHENNLFPTLFDSPLADPLPEPIEAKTVSPAIWLGRLNESVDDVGRDIDPTFYKKFHSFKKLSVNLRRRDYDEEMLVYWSFREIMTPIRRYLIEMDGRYRTMSNLEILREAAQEFLIPIPSIQKLVDQFKAEHFKKRMLGLHIRATDLMAPVETLLQTAVRTAEKEQCDGVFCATDNAEVEDRARKLLPNLITLPKQLPKGAVPLHDDPDCHDRFERAVQALIDMLLLSECDHLVFASRSSFAYAATLFSKNRQPLIDVDGYNLKIQLKRYVQSWIY